VETDRINMMNKSNQKKQFGVMWLNKSSFSLYTESILQPVQHIFSENIVNYLEIIDEVQFETDMDFFIQQSKLPPTNFVLVLAQDMLFEKEFSTAESIQINSAERQFVDSVPFENVNSKTWRSEDKLHMAAFNADFYSYIKMSLEKAGSSITAVIPYFAVEKNQLDQDAIDSINTLVKKHEALKQANFIDSLPVVGETNPNENQPKKSIHSKREFILIGIFIFMLLILFGFIYWAL